MNDQKNTPHNLYDWKQEVYQYLKSPDQLRPDELEHLLRRSFITEEFLMVCSGYPDYEHQYTAHRSILNHLQTRWIEPEQCRHLQTFLHHWMRQHDLLCDRYFQEYFIRWEQQKRIHSWEQWNPEYVVLTTKIGRIG